MKIEITIQGPLVLVLRDLGEFSVRGAVMLAGDHHALVWDTLASPSDMHALGVHLAGREVTVVYSHADWDHCWGTAGLAATPPRAIVAHRAAAERFARELPATLASMRAAARASPPSGESPDSVGRSQEEPAAMNTRERGRWDDVRLYPPTVHVEKGLTLDVGGLTVQLEPVPGHSPDSLVAWLPQLGVLLAGDAAEDPLPEVNQPEELSSWAAALDRWSAQPGLRQVVPGHGDVGGPALLTENARYLRALLEGSGATGEVRRASWTPGGPPTQGGDDEPPLGVRADALSHYYQALHAANLVAVARWAGGTDASDFSGAGKRLQGP